MIKKLLGLALGLLALLVSAPAFADEGDPGRIYWNPTAEQLPAIIQRGDTVCDGTPWQNSCYTYFRVSGELAIHYTLRQRRGVGTNFGTYRLVRATDDGFVMRDEAGNVITTLSKTAVVENGPARMFQVFSAAFNGMGASAVSGLACALNGCGSGGGSVAYAISGSEAEATIDALVGGGGCTTGTCGAPPPNHTQNGTGN